LAKYLGEKASRNALQRYLERHWSQDEIDEMGFYNDIEDEDRWIWRFELGEESHSLAVDRHTGKIKHNTYGPGHFNTSHLYI
jgi:hypothetical protein